MLQAFIDDSASNEGDRQFFLAGYVATADRWRIFSSQWDFALRKRPAIDFLHMHEAEAMRGPFQGWSRQTRDKKIMQLADVVNRMEPFPVECSISLKKYEEVMDESTRLTVSPYYFCFYGLMNSLAAWQHTRGSKLPIDFIFDNQNGAGRDALLWYDLLRKDGSEQWRSLLGGTPQFKDDKEVKPLQAADMLAWHLRRATTKRFLERHNDVLELLLGKRHLKITLSDEQLIQIRDAMPQVPAGAEKKYQQFLRDYGPILRARLAAGLGPPTPWENFTNRLREPILFFVNTKGRRIARKSRRLLRVVRRWFRFDLHN